MTAPAFSLADQNGTTRTLKQYAGRPVVLFFYPKDDTPGCTKEACAFRDMLPKFDDQRAVILGVSPDDSASHAAFVEKFDLNFALLADPPAADGASPSTCDAYGVWGERSLHGKKIMGVARTTFLINGDGVIHKRWDDVRVDGHAEDVFDEVTAMLG